MFAHLLLAHGHAVDGLAEPGERNRLVGTQFFSAIFAGKDDGEVAWRHLEAETRGGLIAVLRSQPQRGMIGQRSQRLALVFKHDDQLTLVGLRLVIVDG